MALIEVFHMVASQLPIATASSTDIPQGRIVTLNSAGEVQLADGNGAAVVASTDPLNIGIAGDSRSQGVTSYTAESGQSTNQAQGYVTTDLGGALILGAYGDSARFTQNRVADNYNEVLASGKMTVYHSGGEFWTDQYEVTYDTAGTTATYTPGLALWSSRGDGAATNRGLFSEQAVAESANGESAFVGICLTAPTAYPSGVPGTGPNAVGFSALPEGGNSLSWGNFLHVKLCI